MGEMKSAMERALERVEGMGKLSAEEMREREEAEYSPLGRAIAERYLNHGRSRFFVEEVGGHAGEEGRIVRRAAFARLVEAVDPADFEASERALAGILALDDRENVAELIEGIGRIFSEYGEAVEKTFQNEGERIEQEERELLHQLRISGSAVGDINMRASEGWGAVYNQVYSQFSDRLGALKRDLMNLLED